MSCKTAPTPTVHSPVISVLIFVHLCTLLKDNIAHCAFTDCTSEYMRVISYCACTGRTSEYMRVISSCAFTDPTSEYM